MSRGGPESKACANFEQVTLGVRREVRVAGTQRASHEAGDTSRAGSPRASKPARGVWTLSLIGWDARLV